MNAAIVEFMVVTGTQWAQTEVAHGEGHIIHKKSTRPIHTLQVGQFEERSGCFELAVVCHSSLIFNTITHIFVDYETLAPLSF